MRGLSNIYLFFATSLISSIMLDSVYHMTNYVEISFLVLKSDYFVIMYATLLWTSLRFQKICKPLVVYQI